MISSILTGVSLLLHFFTFYGASTDGAPDITPAFNNYQQDVVGGGSLFGNLTLVDGERMFSSAGQMQIDTTDYQFKWFVDDVFMTDLASPQVGDLEPEEDGVVMVRLEITYLPKNLVFERSYWAYLGFNNVPDVVDPERPGQFDVFIDFYPDVEPYHYASMTQYDFNSDGVINASDLLELLTLI